MTATLENGLASGPRKNGTESDGVIPSLQELREKLRDLAEKEDPHSHRMHVIRHAVARAGTDEFAASYARFTDAFHGEKSCDASHLRDLAVVTPILKKAGCRGMMLHYINDRVFAGCVAGAPVAAGRS